ncbi:MAG TPA: CDP-diacylglycerol--serine O-phosphatidyltransferase [Anaerolineae bacterium]|nr:CDP-diacylglycerol--serine O-phosphatidyltransferase [Anaerolineae bacterium]
MEEWGSAKNTLRTSTPLHSPTPPLPHPPAPKEVVLPRKLTAIIPSVATVASLVFGVLAIMLLAEGSFLLAAILILLGAILDVLDGHLAVRLNAISDIGKELDSLADVVTFGVAPTMLVYHLLLSVGVNQYLAIFSSLTFVVAGAYRLARFNVRSAGRMGYFQGLPIPMAAGLLIAGSFWRHWALNAWWTTAVILVSYLLVSPFPYPKSTRIFSLPPVFFGVLLALAIICWLVAGWRAVPFSFFLLYALTGPLHFSFNKARSN